MHDPHDRDWQTWDAPASKAREIPRLPETLLWTLSKKGHPVTAAKRKHPIGVELIIRIDDALLRSEAFTLDRRRVMEDLAAEARRDFEARGWTAC